MIRLTMFSGAQHTMSGRHKLYITLFGGSELYQPTFAKQMLQRKYGRRGRMSWLGLPKDVVFTLFGGTEIIRPALADEFVDLRVLLSAGLLSRAEWDEAVYRLAGGDTEDYLSFTLFGGLETKLADKEHERNRIEAHRQAGIISEQEADRLDEYVGRPVGAVAADIADMATLPNTGRAQTT